MDDATKTRLAKVRETLRQRPALQAAALAALPQGTLQKLVPQVAAAWRQKTADHARQAQEAPGSSAWYANLIRQISREPTMSDLLQSLESKRLREHLRRGGSLRSADQLTQRRALGDLERTIAKHVRRWVSREPHVRPFLKTPQGHRVAAAYAEIQELGKDASEEAHQVWADQRKLRARFARARAVALVAAVRNALSH